MTRTVWLALAVLVAWAFITLMRRMSEQQRQEKLQDGEGGSGYQRTSMKDDIDWEELERAEDEVRGVDPTEKPEDGFEGDDWGPGTAPKPPVA